MYVPFLGTKHQHCAAINFRQYSEQVLWLLCLIVDRVIQDYGWQYKKLVDLVAPQRPCVENTLLDRNVNWLLMISENNKYNTETEFILVLGFPRTARADTYLSMTPLEAFTKISITILTIFDNVFYVNVILKCYSK